MEKGTEVPKGSVHIERIAPASSPESGPADVPGSPPTRRRGVPDPARYVQLFTGLWLVGSLIVSAVFAFVLFPAMYETRMSAVVSVYFQAQVPLDLANDTRATQRMYYPNNPAFRARFGQYLSDTTFLYFSACQALPLSQRPACDGDRNWIRIDPDVLEAEETECRDAASCAAQTYRVTEEARYQLLSGVIPVDGSRVDVSDLAPPSLSDPAGWGSYARWPLFFICMFMALKLGRALGEFVFTPYEK